MRTNRLLSQMQQTARCRFTAAKRLESRDRKITRLTALSSAYLIVLTVLPYFLNLPEVVADHINLLSVLMSVVVLASSLLQYSRSDVVAAEQHHRSALEINELVRQLSSEPQELDRSSYLNYSHRYGALLQKYSVNHDDIDYKSVQLERPHEYTWMSWGYIWKAKARLFWDKHAADMILATMSVFLIGLILAYVLPSQINDVSPATNLVLAT